MSKKLSNLTENEKNDFAQQIKKIFEPIQARIDKLPLGEVRQLKEQLSFQSDDISTYDEIPVDELLKLTDRLDLEQAEKDNLIKQIVQIMSQLEQSEPGQVRENTEKIYTYDYPANQMTVVEKKEAYQG
jgi:Asp-tRNA(Asn)/Glu-tRNA(Gln) amidotransferase C subunit